MQRNRIIHAVRGKVTCVENCTVTDCNLVIIPRKLNYCCGELKQNYNPGELARLKLGW